ncbi:MAG: MerR family transcriptional regulator [Chloroflexi bacterium]|nr:MerR family transcriptional regulator [Chloroflexota bacterium]
MDASPRTVSIGELARSAGTTRRTLHHYHAIGLLLPAHRTESGYRRYTTAEISRLRRIQTLRALGLSLYQIGRVLDRQEAEPLQAVLADQLQRTDGELEEARARREMLGVALEGTRAAPSPSLGQIIDSLETTMQPAAQTTIAILAYHDLDSIHDFLVDAFQMRPGGVQHDDKGRAVHAEVYAADGSAIWLHRNAPEHGLVSPRDVDKATGGVVVLVDDVNGHYRHAQSKGAQIDYLPTDQDYGLREYGARDPEGGRWYFGKPI